MSDLVGRDLIPRQKRAKGQRETKDKESCNKTLEIQSRPGYGIRLMQLVASFFLWNCMKLYRC